MLLVTDIDSSITIRKKINVSPREQPVATSLSVLERKALGFVQESQNGSQNSKEKSTLKVAQVNWKECD